ncbi:uncharacterized protein LOC110727203 [Chenopodium quinoa]|uniref:uncharacterized protein LOC110727203 n=1 Tax=Chenopodium quinoa TaxID=63459 RepID=UPI000B78B87C|nr:uncharacterized protein LOC110727203 [Chenopodium quinoa]
MEDSFRVRVDKTFGSLSSSSSPPSSSLTLTSSLWCLTDEEIQKRQWPPESDASIPTEEDDVNAAVNDAFLPTNVDKFFFAAKGKSMPSEQNPSPNLNPNDLGCGKELKEDLNELDNNGGEGSSENMALSQCNEDVGGDDDELDVRNSIGKDCTLDFEAEEDEYDKVAVGSENVGQRLYMSDVTDYTSNINSYYELPETLKEAPRDPRANHMAAKLRLKEDAETARSFNSLHVSDQMEDDVSGAQNNVPEDGNLPKSILKRKDDQMDSKAGKRVRFEPICKRDDHSASEDSDIIVMSETSSVDYSSFKESSSQLHDSSLVPDYVRHPLRYTHYTFDSSDDMNEECNRQAYTDFLNMVKKSKSEPEEAPADLTKPVIFNPKKNDGVASLNTSKKTDHAMGEPVQKKSFPLIITAEDTEENEAAEMEVDEQETPVLKVGNGKRAARRYRSKIIEESKEHDS